MEEGKNKRTMFWPLAAATAVYGIVYHFFGEFLLGRMMNHVWNPFVIAVYVTFFFVLLIPVYLFFAAVTNNLYYTNRVGDRLAKKFLYILGMIAGVFVLTLLLEFLYELGGGFRNYNPTSYIFVIDDSGSMYENDPKNQRADAIREIMKDSPQLPYAVYRFSDSAELIRDMAIFQDNEQNITFHSEGNTDILGALSYISSDLQNAVIDGGNSPKVILLSDGQSYADGMESILKYYQDHNISISTVGFGSVDRNLMTNISHLTGGVFVYSDNVGSLKDNMTQAIKESSTRTLLSARFRTSNDWLYAFLRIFFLILIAGALAFGKAKSAFSIIDENLIFYMTAVAGGIAALICEIFMNSFYWSENIVRLLMDILWAVSLCTIEHFKGPEKKEYADAKRVDSSGLDEKRERKTFSYKGNSESISKTKNDDWFYKGR